MSIHTYKCKNKDCKIKDFDSIELPGTQYTKCPVCGEICKRKGMELPSPAQIEVGVGGVYRGKFGERKF